MKKTCKSFSHKFKYISFRFNKLLEMHLIDSTVVHNRYAYNSIFWNFNILFYDTLKGLHKNLYTYNLDLIRI